MKRSVRFLLGGLRRWRVPHWLSFFAAGAAALAYFVLLTRDDAYRVALGYAGDLGLPNLALYQDAQAIRAFAAHLGTGAGAHAYQTVLGLCNGLVALLLAMFLSIAWLAWRTSPAWSSALATAALLYAASDWTAVEALRQAAGTSRPEAAPYALAAFSTTAKSILLLVVCAPLSIAGLVLAFGSRRSWWIALFMDLPYLIDRGWRRLEFRLNQEFVNEPGPGLAPRRFWHVPPFWLYLATLIFVCYGPTPGGLCSIEPDTVRYGLYVFSCFAIGLLGHLFLARSAPILHRHVYGANLLPAAGADEAQRRHISATVLIGAVASFYLFALWAALSLLLRAQNKICDGIERSDASLLRFVLCAAAIVLFSLLWLRVQKTSTLLRTQAILITGVALIEWFLLADVNATEASGKPYRHLFGVLAPATCVVLWLALGIAERQLRGALAPMAAVFRGRLAQTELFVDPPRPPEPTGARVLHGMLNGLSNRFLELALLPAMIAVVAPQRWLAAMTALALIMSAAVSTWGNMSSRWQQMALFIERWFLSGTAFFVSLFVLALAGARLWGVSYVTTLLDAAPFGVIFAGVVMTYVLSWLVEYWINRVAATELLAMLGAQDGASWVAYPYAHSPALPVQQENRFVAYQAIGRLAVMGRLTRDEKPAWHTYSLTELFRALAGHELRDHATEMNRRLQLYFYQVNGLLVAATAALVLSYVYFYQFAEQIPVVSAAREGDAARLRDLAERLLDKPGDTRPALVVAASGGGTRAALYTSHVLESLHRVGADRDIALASGVSGGGVALAYFAAHYPELVAEQPPASRLWADFRHAAAQDFVDDVLGGASEWRIFGTVPLTLLLAESFERRLFRDTRRRSFDLPDGPALILNTTVAGHPEEESRLLGRMLDRPKTGGGCAEAARPYKMLEGGRLIFTNLKHTGAFPGRESEIPDLRLPYEIVRDPRVLLQNAAALTANFPPVFPNAHVLIKGAPERECADRSYFVTDGGAEENLGLVSALFAVKSALQEISDRCAKDGGRRDPWCARKLRPVHFVIVEASAAAFDYRQDRGVSAGLGGAKERMTGETTNLLIEQTNALYGGLKRAKADAKKMQFHFIGLPLAYRARGGFGTHWTHPDPVELADPRKRTALEASRPSAHTSLSQLEISTAWSALLDPFAPYCESRGVGTIQTDTVLRWICGDRNDPRAPRDLSVLEWQRLLKELRVGPPQP